MTPHMSHLRPRRLNLKKLRSCVYLISMQLTLLLTSCHAGRQAHITIPTAYVEDVEKLPGSGEEQLAQWWQLFDDSQLTSLIKSALQKNRNLHIAYEKICQARAACKVEFSTLLPQIDGFALFNRMRNSKTLADELFLGGTFINLYQVGFDSIWEIDLFGKNLERTRAAAYTVAMEEEDMYFARITIASEVANAYFTIRTLQTRIDIAKQHILNEQELIDIVESRYNAGLISMLDIYNAQALLAARRSAVPRLEARLYQTIYALAVLIGEVPEALTGSFTKSKPLPIYHNTVPLGLPSELLCRRPDVRAKEFALYAAGANLSAARKELFPTLSLESLYSFATSFFHLWPKGDSKQWSIFPSLTLPIFHGGGIIAHINEHSAIQRQAALAYEQSVLEALQEVESALVGYFREEKRIELLEEEISAYKHARNIALDLYVAGRVDFLNVVDIERDLFITENLLAESQETMMSLLVALYKALGGGWQCSQ